MSKPMFLTLNEVIERYRGQISEKCPDKRELRSVDIHRDTEPDVTRELEAILSITARR
jgi:hypothetical protein